MCCILCEEPVRSVTFGLAALGIVAIVNSTRKVLARSSKPEQAEQDRREACEAATGDIAS